MFSILLIAFWSAVTYHIAQKDYRWIISKVKKLVIIWMLFVIGVFFVSLIFNNIVSIWLGNNADEYDPWLIALFASYCAITSFTAIFVNVLNGIGAIKVQFMLGVIEAIINIPLSIFFARYCEMGIFGVKFATLICSLMSLFILPLNAIMILKKYVGDDKKYEVDI